MKDLHNPICRSGWNHCDSEGGNELAKAHSAWIDKLHQLGFVTQLVSVKLSEMMKPAILFEATERLNPTGDTRSRMMLRVSRRWRMNVGDPNEIGVTTENEGSRICS